MRYVATALVVALLASSASARAQHASPDRLADEHLAKADKMFGDGNYAAAIDELRAGYFIRPQPRFLYALGQAYRLNHDCADAVKAYREFLSYQPPPSQVSATNLGIKACEEETPTPKAAAEPRVVTPAPTAGPASSVMIAEPPRRTPIYKRWWLWTSVGVVAAGVAVGLGVGLTHNDYHFGKSLTPGDIGPGLKQ